MKVLVGILVLCIASVLYAQTPSRSVKIGDGFADYNDDRLKELSDLYFSGDWNQLQQRTMQTLEPLQFRAANGAQSSEAKFDFGKHFYSVVFLYVAPDRKEEVLRYLVHSPAPEPYTARLPGISDGDEAKFYEVYLTYRPEETFASAYLSIKERGTLQSQLPRFLKQFDPKVLEDLLQAVPSRNRIHAVISRVDFPFSRATIQVEDVIHKEKGSVAASSKIFNRPFTRFSFGIVSSIIATSNESSPRATLQSGDLTLDPVRGHMPMGILNIHPFAYDADSDAVSWKERFRFFVGGIFNPEFGVSAGAGFQIIRGFSVNAGVGVLVIDTLKSGESFGQEPVDPEDPFEYGTATVLFFGAGYNF